LTVDRTHDEDLVMKCLRWTVKQRGSDCPGHECVSCGATFFCYGPKHECVRVKVTKGHEMGIERTPSFGERLAFAEDLLNQTMDAED
jgi:hypothetical protein